MIKFLGTILLAILALLCFIYFDELVLDGDFLDRSIGTNSRVIRSLIYALANTEIGYYLVRSIPIARICNPSR